MATPIVAVAYSGGRDSSALLHATLAVAAGDNVEVVALHVHHGLSAQADAWLQHCERQCRVWAAHGKRLSFAFQCLTTRPAKGESVEAWARKARYRALREMALVHGTSLVLLAHHQRDQVETFLLQALRGAGVAGLAAMPKVIERAGITWMRPWLNMPRLLIDSYVAKHRLRYVDDDSNADLRFARNRLRLSVWPALQAAFAQAESTLADTARWAFEAQSCSDELAAMDLAQISDIQGLSLRAWALLSPARRSNALRAWLKGHLAYPAPAALVQRLMVELLSATTPAQWPAGVQVLRRYRGRLQCVACTHAKALTMRKEEWLGVTRSGIYPLPGWAGRLQVCRVKEDGVPVALLKSLRLVARKGGEQFQTAQGRPPRALKKQFQLLSVPDWERSGPLLYAGEFLVFVPGLGIDARAKAAHGVAQVTLKWLPDA